MKIKQTPENTTGKPLTLPTLTISADNLAEVETLALLKETLEKPERIKKLTQFLKEIDGSTA